LGRIAETNKGDDMSEAKKVIAKVDAPSMNDGDKMSVKRIRSYTSRCTMIDKGVGEKLIKLIQAKMV